MARIEPALSFNFWVLLWDVQGPGTFDLDLETSGQRFGVGLATGLLSSTTQALFGAFSDASGLNAHLEVETYQEGGNNIAPLRFPEVGQVRQRRAQAWGDAAHEPVGLACARSCRVANRRSASRAS